MIGKNFKLYATIHLLDAFCECGERLIEVSNGWFSKAGYCPKCENVYVLKLVKVPKRKVSREFLEQCRAEVKRRCK